MAISKAALLVVVTASVASAQTPGWSTALPACTQRSAKAPAAWPIVDVAAEGFRFRVPPGTVRKPSPLGTCSHGCEDWTNGGLTVRATKGTWGESSFGDAHRRHACALREGVVTLVVMRPPERRSVTVWSLRGGRPTKDTTSIVEVMWDASAAAWADAVVASVEPY